MAAVDVLDELRPAGGAVALPRLDAVGVIVGREEKLALERSQTGRVRGAEAEVDVLNEPRPAGGAFSRF